MDASSSSALPLRSIADIKYCLYINLESRPDRRQHIEQELPKIGLKPPVVRRFNAVCLPKKSGSGAVGCTMSHLRCLEMARKNGWPHVAIVEDDILFTNPAVFVENFNRFLTAYEGRFDVVLLAGNNFPPFVQKHPFCVKVSRCQTTTGYLVMSHYYDTLIENIRTGLMHLMRDPEERVGLQYTEAQLKYSIDKHWFQLQESGQWFLITPLTVTQRDDYSDIEERATAYSPAMLDLDKSAFFRRRYVSINGGAAAQKEKGASLGQMKFA